jgi:D-alanyl-D-alanine carboxypeptidase
MNWRRIVGDSLPDWTRGTLILCLAVGLGAVSPSPARGDVAALVVEVETGRVIHEEISTRRWYPASLTKVMTLYIAFEELAAGRLQLDQILVASPYAASQSPTRLGLTPGRKITVREAVAAVAVVSANDCAVLLAERIAGSEEAFAKRMTDTAFRLGLTGTQFSNATGLPDSQQSTTARDMAMLGLAILRDFSGFHQLFSLRQMPWNGSNHPTTNGFLSRFEGADGFKTGFTCGSGYNLLASSVRNGRRLVGVVLGSKASEERHGLMRRLFSAAYAQPPPGDKAPIVSALKWEKAEAENVPPFQLITACNIVLPGTSVPRIATIAGNVADKPDLGGGDWGILFGQFSTEAAAQGILRRAKAIVQGGRPTAIRRKDHEGSYWKALLLGFDHQGAARGCSVAQQRASIVCIVASPESLAGKGLLVRW